MNSLQRIIWLASYPKSGNTWTRSFLANYFQPQGHALDINSLRLFTTADVRQDFFDRAAGRPFRAQTVEDWIKVRPRALQLIAASKPGHHFVKTHCQIGKIQGVDLIPPQVTAAAVYILRNPFDVAPSLARHLAVDLDTAIARLADRTTVHATPTHIFEIIGRWDDHIRTWTSAPGLPLHVMRYEDMLADPAAAFRRLFGFLKLEVDAARLERALELTSFDAMQKQEREQGFLERPKEMQQFFHSGTSGGWRKKLSPAQVGRIRREFRVTLKKWYPELMDETRDFAQSAEPESRPGEVS
jgi:hypothetical protein